jgi:hypothetical protein
MLTEITQKIIDLLVADKATLGIDADNFFFGPPFTRNKNPFCYVTWAGGPIKAHTANTEEWDFNWHIVVVDVAKTDDDAEESVMDKIERVREVLRANRTLDGLVIDSQPVSAEGEVMTVGADWGTVNQIIAAARLTLNVFIRKGST